MSFESMAAEQAEYDKWQEERYISECGVCPNCNKTVHMSEMGTQDGIVCCRHCHEEVLKNLKSLNEVLS